MVSPSDTEVDSIPSFLTSSLVRFSPITSRIFPLPMGNIKNRLSVVLLRQFINILHGFQSYHFLDSIAVYHLYNLNLRFFPLMDRQVDNFGQEISFPHSDSTSFISTNLHY